MESNAKEIFEKVTSSINKICIQVDKMLAGDLNDITHVKKMKILVDTAHKLAKLPNLLYAKLGKYSNHDHAFNEVLNDNIRLKRIVDQMHKEHLQRVHNQKMRASI